MADNVYDFKAKTIEGQDLSLDAYRGKVLLIVNVASRCGFTPQYRGLEQLYRKHKADGLEILGFPCNQFGAQEPGNEEEIKSFCSASYDVSFPMFAKVDVNGDAAHPLYRYLKSEEPGILGTEAVKWNFTKFLVGRDGKPVKRFAPNTAPEDMEGELTALLR